MLNGAFAPSRFHSKKPVAGTRHLRLLKLFLKDGFSVILSALALINLLPTDKSFAQEGTSPHRKNPRVSGAVLVMTARF
jgi:hypothetical protein